MSNPYNQNMIQSAGTNLTGMMIDSNTANRNTLNQK